MRLIERRVGLLFAVFALALGLVVVRAAWLQGVKGAELSADARSQQKEAVVVPGERGRIVDRNGEELAVSEEAATVVATPYQVEDAPRTAERLAEALDRPVEEVLSSLTSSTGFEFLARRIDLARAERVRKLDLAGVTVLPDSRRVYPQGEIGGRLIGAVGTDGEGLFGLESAWEDGLRAVDGELEVTLDALGKEIGRDLRSGAERGADVRLTIDAEIQARAEDVLAGVGETYDPAGATAIAVDPRAGEVLAMASWPPIDPTDLASIPEDALSNMATGFTYEPGSTFKAFTVAGALGDDLVSPDTVFELPPTIQVADRTIGEAHDRGATSLTVAEILSQSSNVGAVKVGLELNGGAFGSRFDRWVRRFGFSRPTGIDSPGEEQGIVPSPEQYSGSTMGNLPIGQGLSVTPIQMVAGYSAIANGGFLRTPQLVRSVAGERVDTAADRRDQRILSRRTASELRGMLEGVHAEGGTAAQVGIPGYALAGKTGTSQKVVDGTYSDSRYVASFVGFAPADRPKLLIAVVVDEPKGDYYGGSVAAPAFGEIAGFALPYLGVRPEGG